MRSGRKEKMLRHDDPMRGSQFFPFLTEGAIKYKPNSAGGG